MAQKDVRKALTSSTRCLHEVHKVLKSTSLTSFFVPPTAAHIEELNAKRKLWGTSF